MTPTPRLALAGLTTTGNPMVAAAAMAASRVRTGTCSGTGRRCFLSMRTDAVLLSESTAPMKLSPSP